MACCCTNTLNLGCVSFCDDVDILTAPDTGDYTITADNGVNRVDIAVTGVTATDTLTLTSYAASLQPGGYSLSVTGPNGAVSSTVDSVTYDCFHVELKPTL